MIKHVHINGDITYADAPWRFEAGTPNIIGIIGLGQLWNILLNLVWIRLLHMKIA
ncbi:bifunctional cysteine desulfurase/selenocysteine lyase [Proteus mirabilis]|uniref:Bifunctional cysteine desulfurase/selenocysteine lyase n=1 Tax=Proteus mirabilis TaxID=584 RepID=A0A379GHR6_PROMI|nr:bifunctional cysteine desulfurase/selenocysteine lyase [Proteus mirabilis]